MREVDVGQVFQDASVIHGGMAICDLDVAPAFERSKHHEELNAPPSQTQANDAEGTEPDEPATLAHPCPCCGGRMIIIETFERGSTPRHRPTGLMVAISIDTS